MTAENSGRLAGLILAGGMGERWGGPKAWATLPDGRTFLGACAGLLSAAGAGRMVATLPPASPDPEIGGVNVFPLPEQNMDMFASLHVGLAHLVQWEDWSLLAVLPVDHPLVAPASVRALADATRHAAVPRYRGKHGHPVCLGREVVTAMVCRELSGPTLRHVLRAIGVVDVDVDDPGVVANCNTPEALSEALNDSNPHDS